MRVRPRRASATAAGEAVDAVIVGAGVVGVACAHYLSRRGARVLIVDSRPPLSYTSAMSTECYRTYFGDHVQMTAFMNRSVDLLETRAAECDNAFSLNRRGYCFLSATDEGKAKHVAQAAAAATLGHTGGAVHKDGGHGVRYRGDKLAYDAAVDGISVFQGHDAVRSFFGELPADFVSAETKSLLHCGRAGWMSAQQMGTQLLLGARAAGARTLTPASVVGVTTADEGARVSGVTVQLGADPSAHTHVACGAVVNCAGPFAGEMGELLVRASRPRSLLGATSEAAANAHARAFTLPFVNEIHAKAMLRDPLGAVPMTAPMMIWEDEVELRWTDEERTALLEMGGFEATLARPLPGGAHFRPYPGATGTVVMLWEALHMDMHVPAPAPPEPQLRGALFAELLIRGLSTMVPKLAECYLADDGSMQATVSVDGGYYTKTPDNLPLIGAVPGAPAGSFVCAGLSGYGVMASNAAGELLAAHVLGGAGAAEPPLPSYAATFRPERWLESDYIEAVAAGRAGKGLQI
jgi:glycine/D-amino acid oxidase-like deaminating enzyme